MLLLFRSACSCGRSRAITLLTAVRFSVKGSIPGGINEAFLRYTNLDLTPWSDEALKDFDAIVMLDVQPMFFSAVLNSADAREGIQSFVERRAAVFQGR